MAIACWISGNFTMAIALAIACCIFGGNFESGGPVSFSSNVSPVVTIPQIWH